MIKIADGRTELWQWDAGVMLVVGSDCNEVHFSNSPIGRALSRKVVDGRVPVPDELLRVPRELHVWAAISTESSRYTKEAAVFRVNSRNKPADYSMPDTPETPPVSNAESSVLGVGILGKMILGKVV